MLYAELSKLTTAHVEDPQLVVLASIKYLDSLHTLEKRVLDAMDEFTCYVNQVFFKLFVDYGTSLFVVFE